MSDSDWRDPFADDQAARDREARRAERAARRREQAQQSLAERVRETEEQPAVAAPPRSPSPPRSPAPPPRPPTGDQARHRRTIGLLALGALIVLVAGVGVVLSRSGDEATAPAAPKERKTEEVVIPEGYDRSQIAQVAKKAQIKGDYEKASVSSRAINLKKYGAQDAESLEGFLFPATYEIFRNDDVDALVDRQLEAFETNLAEVDLTWAKRNGYSVYEIVNVASMIEREIQVPEERKLAASVIYNRLDAGNPLGIDATIRFEDQNYTEPLVESRLNEPTPYNTRINPGLPPGPIGNPGLASLEAAANPAETDYFYYVIKPGTCNEHFFTDSEKEFLAAAEEYQAALEAEGGSPTDC
jgi:cell division protein YceG involved in septum cleavage